MSIGKRERENRKREREQKGKRILLVQAVKLRLLVVGALRGKEVVVHAEPAGAVFLGSNGGRELVNLHTQRVAVLV
jgi:hypothetical protein